MIVRRVVRWTDERLGAAGFARTALRKVFPDHWSFMLGEIALYCFIILILTGVFLTMFFRADASPVIYDGSYEPLQGREISAAYASTLDLSFDVRAGLFMRQVHHWSALLFVAAIVLHLARIFFTGAFRRPREINWFIGLTLLLLALFNGFTGYSLPDDLLSGTGLRIGYSITLSIPLVGTWLAFLVFGGEFPSPDILNRLFAMHVMIVPAIMGALIAAHLAILWRQKHTQFPGPRRTETNVVGPVLWPGYALKSIALFLLTGGLLAALGGLAQINPVWVYGPFEAAAEVTPAQPDWYMGWLEGAMRLFPAWEIRVAGYTIANPFFPTVLLPGLTFAALYAWPFLEARITEDRAPHHLLDRPRDKPVRTALGAAALAFYGVLLMAGSNDVVARVTGASVGTMTTVLRILLVTGPIVAGFATYRIARTLRDSGRRRWIDLSPSEIARGGARR